MLSIVAISFGITIDPLLLKHSIYASSKINNSYGCYTPLNGIVGTNGVWQNGGNLIYIQTESRAKTITGNNWTISSGDTVYYETPLTISCVLASGADTNKVPTIYPILPIFPNFSSQTFTGTTNMTTPGTYFPGQYKSLNPDWTVTSSNPIYLTAGIYNFESITIGSSKKVVIIPNNGSYKTEIYVKNSIAIGDNSKLTVQDTTGYGNVILAQIGSSDITFTSYSEITATIIAQYARVNFNSNAKLVGQVFADMIYLIDFNGGNGIVFKETKVKYPVIVSDTITCQENKSVMYTPTVNFKE